MGRDKAFVEIDGETLLDRAAGALRAAGAIGDVLVIGGDSDQMSGEALEPVADLYPGAGPLGGIITALEAASTEVVVIIACDHLDPSPDAITSVVRALGPSELAVPLVRGRAQWLHAAWRRSVQGRLRSAFDNGARAPRQAAARLDVAWIRALGPEPYRDADTPADLPADIT